MAPAMSPPPVSLVPAARNHLATIRAKARFRVGDLSGFNRRPLESDALCVCQWFAGNAPLVPHAPGAAGG